MLQTASMKKMDETSFIMRFVDNHNKRWTGKLSRTIDTYDTTDGSNCDVKLGINTATETVFIDIIIRYPEELVDNTDSLDELILANEKRFKDFYKEQIKF